MFKSYLRSKDGATAIEYALIALILVLAIAAAAMEVGRLLGENYGNVASEMSHASD